VESPYDTEARHSNKHDLSWTGYKVHVSETCDNDLPHLITHVHTTVATTQDVTCTSAIHQGLADKDLLPGRHLVDAGYVEAAQLVNSQEQHQIELFGPPRGAKGWQVREGGYDPSQFSIDWENEQMTCPEGKVSRSWRLYENPPSGRPQVKVRFGAKDCIACTSRVRCVRSQKGAPRSLAFPPRPLYEALHHARQHLTSETGAQVYKKRAGVEGTLSQGVRRSDLRHCRYRGLVKANLQHVAIAAALNIVRTTEYLAGRPIAKTRTSRFARLAV
jgi:transposase